MDKSINKITEVEVNGKIYKKVRTVFDKDNSKSVGRTQQHFRKEANINEILKKFKKSGLLTDPRNVPTVPPQYGDFTGVVDFQTAQNKLIAVKRYFDSLPAEIRKKFENSPEKLVYWITNPENAKEAREIGLLPRDLSQVRYFRTLADGSREDCTAEVIANRGLFVNGKRVNVDGTPYVEVSEKVEDKTTE